VCRRPLKVFRRWRSILAEATTLAQAALWQNMKISVVTVCRNSAATIGATLQSVAQQAYPQVEHVVVDGLSVDDTMAIVNARKRAGSVVVSEADNGIYDAMNKGIALARGDVIGFLNSDDVYADTGVLRAVAEVFSDPSVDICYADLIYVDRNDIDKSVRWWQSGPFTPGKFGRGWVPPHPTFFARRQVYEKCGGFDTQFRLAADFELMARVMERYHVRSRYIPRVLVKMRLGGVTNRNFRNIFRQNLEIRGALKKNGLNYNPFIFLGSKVIDRARQRLRARR